MIMMTIMMLLLVVLEYVDLEFLFVHLHSARPASWPDGGDSYVND